MHDPGIWSYIASTGASTHVVRANQNLLALRLFASGSTGSVRFFPRTTSTGQTATTANPAVKVRSDVGFDWSPAAKVAPLVFVVSAAVDVFGEVSSHG